MWKHYRGIQLFYSPATGNGVPLSFNFIKQKQWQQFSLIQILKQKY